jgi:hypothetical protein
MDFRHISLVIAESVDAWRIIPRTILVLYSTLVFNLYLWYKSIPTYVQEQCDPSVLRVLMELQMSVEEAKVFACSVVDIVGGPTAAQSAFVTTIIGLSTGIFGLYVATGRKWERGLPHDANPQFPPHTPVNPYGPPNTRHPTYGPSPNDSTYGPSSPPHGRRPHKPPYGPWGESNEADKPDDEIT